jgi:hypothetical protein
VAVLEIRPGACVVQHSGSARRDACAHADDPLVAVLENGFGACARGASRGSRNARASDNPHTGGTSNAGCSTTCAGPDTCATGRSGDRSASAGRARGAGGPGPTAHDARYSVVRFVSRHPEGAPGARGSG